MVNAFLDSLGLGVLDNHWKVLLGSALACNFIVQISQLISPLLFPATYPKLQWAKKLNWDVHVVSTVHATTIVFLATPLLWNETLMKDRIFGYDYDAGQIYADKLGMTGTIYQLINGVILLSLFLGVRIIFGIYMSYQTYQSAIVVIDQIPWHLIIVYSLANVILNSLNIFWFYKMIESLMKRFQPTKKSSKENGKTPADVKRE
ncbi:hypothetical protein BGZ49_008986 [Haplosporangium sp. Z 27]|nr:hypothetical protein BGZ49_008986 [Haplosporangium sp. Z 27]